MWGRAPREPALSEVEGSSRAQRRTTDPAPTHHFVLTPHPNRSKMHRMRARLWAPPLMDVRKEGVRGTSERHGQVVQ